MSKTIMAVDLGTTSCRAILFDLQGRVLGQASRSYPLNTPRPGYAEQNPAELIAAAEAVVPEAIARAGVSPADVLGVSLCTYMHGLIAIGPAGEFLTPVITWADGRSASQAEEMRTRTDWMELYRRTGCPPHTMYPLYKFMWMGQHHPDLLKGATRFASIKEVLVHRWTGQWAVDYNLGTGTGLFNMHNLDWDEWALELAGVRQDQLAPLAPPSQSYPLTSSRLGLLPGTPVIIGAGDGVLSSLGSGAIEPGVLAAMVGTSGAFRACVPEATVDPQARLWCYYLDKGHWILGGSLNNGGMVLRWYRDNFYPGEREYDAVLAEAQTVPPGSGSLVMVPHLSGERSPGFNARARALWFGLGLEHTRAHMGRSVLEAIAYSLYSVLGPIEEVAGPAREIRATGGFARSDFWLQICADVFGRTLTVPSQTEGSALGAFVMGAVGLGVAPDISWVHQFIEEERRLQPDAGNHELYTQLFEIYQQVSRNIQPQYHHLAAIREREV